jgi:hypothetical protein
MAGCFVDHRDPGRVQHSLVELVSQRVLGLALLPKVQHRLIGWLEGLLRQPEQPCAAPSRA